MISTLRRLESENEGVVKLRARCAELSEALADTRCYLPGADDDGSTGGGWRTDPAYYEMRNTFGMFYQPGGTGTEKNG